MHDPIWFANMEREWADREAHRDIARDEREAQQVLERALEPEYKMHEANKVLRGVWVCPYCQREMTEEQARMGCCGEVHAEYVEVCDDNDF